MTNEPTIRAWDTVDATGGRWHRLGVEIEVPADNPRALAEARELVTDFLALFLEHLGGVKVEGRRPAPATE
jgi:hypothetical protein